MEPTICEVIFWIVFAVVSLVILAFCVGEPDDTIEMTWGKKRDIARAERRGW